MPNFATVVALSLELLLSFAAAATVGAVAVAFVTAAFRRTVACFVALPLALVTVATKCTQCHFIVVVITSCTTFNFAANAGSLHC